MPEFPIVDTHLHLWDTERFPYPWLENNEALGRPFLLPDYHAATEDVDLAKMVFVECAIAPGQNVAEAAFIAELAEADPRIRGMVASAALEKGEGAREELDALAEYPLVRGVRRLLQAEKAGFGIQADFLAGVRLLKEYGWSFDICIVGEEQMRNALELVRQCPEISFIVDHMSNPYIAEGLMEPWAGLIRELAGEPNLCCKVSGIMTRAAEGWQSEDLKPYVEHVIECFGWERVIHGGDWPVATLGGSYARWIASLDEILAGESAENRRKLFRENAERFYRV